jgi:8-oxo-dGTP diphosphatase
MSTPNPTILPAVSVAMVRGDRVLLVKRARKPSAGFYAFPGGRVEDGEADIDAAARELLEETGLEGAELLPLVTVNIPPSPTEGTPGYRLVVFAARWIAGEPVAADDAAEAKFFTREELVALPTTDSTAEIALDLLDGRI